MTAGSFGGLAQLGGFREVDFAGDEFGQEKVALGAEVGVTSFEHLFEINETLNKAVKLIQHRLWRHDDLHRGEDLGVDIRLRGSTKVSSNKCFVLR